jgi:hypothetical protein
MQRVATRDRAELDATVEEAFRQIGISDPAPDEPRQDEPPPPTEYPESADGEPNHEPAPGGSQSASAPYRFETMVQMAAEPIERDWIIKGIFARRETSAWIAPPGGGTLGPSQCSRCRLTRLAWPSIVRRLRRGVLCA